MKNTIKKIEEVIESIYVKELLGVSIYDRLHIYTVLNDEVQELRRTALDYELKVLSNQPYNDIRLKLVERINAIHTIALTIEDYRMSYLFFNDQGMLNEELI